MLTSNTCAGVPIHHIAANSWENQAHLLQASSNPSGSAMLHHGQAPREGDVMVMPELANTFRLLAEQGKDAFYNGKAAAAIVDAVQGLGGIMTADDLASHTSTYDNPICVDFNGQTVWEIPPNGQGITALIALNILKHVPGLEKLEHNSWEYLHVLIEATRLAFADTTWYVADPSKVHVPIKELLSEEYAKTRAALISMDKAIEGPDRGSPVASSNTVYFTVRVDVGCSFI